MSSISGKNIVLGISGGIAAYKSCDLTRMLVKNGANVHVVLTEAAKKFVTPLTLQTLSGNPVYQDMFSLIEEKDIGHISLAEQADLILVAPATANIIAKVANGICDDLLTTVICASNAPVLFAPSMNTNMWENLITQKNIRALKEFNYKFIEPESGELACGTEGKGRLPELERIISCVEDVVMTSRSPGHVSAIL